MPTPWVQHLSVINGRLPAEESTMDSIGSISSAPVYIPQVTRQVDRTGGLYEAKLPGSESKDDPAVGLIYSSKGLNADNNVPSNAVYLKDSNGDYFSVDADRISMVATGKDLDLYVFQSDGTADRYTFNVSDGKLKTDTPTNLNAVDFSAAEVAAKRDLDGNGGIGALLIKTPSQDQTSGVLDSVGGVFKVSSMGENLFVVGSGLDKSKSIDASKSALLDAQGNAWRPEEEFTQYTAVSSTSKTNGTTWSIYATDANGDVTRFNFDRDRQLIEDETLKLTLHELAAAEKQTLRDLNKDNVFGVNINGTIDKTTGLFKGSVLGQDFYLVGNALKSGTAKAPTDLSGALVNQDGTAWGLPEEFVASAMVKNTYADGESGPAYSVYAHAKNGDTADRNNVLRFDFEANDGNWKVSADSENGVEVDATALAAAEKLAKRDLNGDSVFGVKIDAALDSVGGLFQATALGNEFLVVGRGLTSSASKPLDLSSALKTADGEAWRPEDVSNLTGKLRIVNLGSDQGYEVYAKEDSGTFAKYTFDKDFTLTEAGDREELSIEALATAEKLHKRDLNGDNAFGVVVSSLVDARSNVYKASFENQQNIYLAADKKLTVGSKVASNGVDLSLALKSGDDYWNVDDGYKVTAGYKDGDNFVMVATSTTNANDIRKYSFDSDNQLLDEEGKTGDMSLADLTAAEKALGRDLNGDKITGVKASTTLDKTGGLHSVTLGTGNNAQTFLSVGAKAGDVKDLSTALLDNEGNAWKLGEGETVAALVTEKTGTDVSGYALYTSKTLQSGEKQITQYRFNSEFTYDEDNQDNSKVLSQIEISDVEVASLRDINGDKSVGAQVTAVLDKVGGLYQATMNDGLTNNVTSFVSSSAPGKATGLSNKMLLDADGASAWKVDSGFTIRGMISHEDGSYSVYASKSGQADEVRRYNFDDTRALTETEELTAEDVIAAEKVAGRDMNGDKAVGLNIADAVDRKGALYNANVLGQDYLVIGTAGATLRTGRNSDTAIDLSRALLAPDGSAWKAETGWSIGGVVNNSDGGYDVYTYQKDADNSITGVKVHSWDDKFEFVDSQDADQVALVEVERNNKRDLSGDGVVGFRSLGAPEADSGLAGVTQATVAGGITFLLAGTNLRNGTPSNPLSVKNALLNEDGTGPWAADTGFKVKAVDDSDPTLTAGKRYVYAVNDDTDEVRRYEFDKTTGKSSGAGETMSAVDLAAREIARRRDFNGDGAAGVATVSSVLDGTRQTGLLNATIAGKDFLVINKPPAAGRNISLASVLLDDAGAAWKNPEDFIIKGVYETKEGDNDIAEVYGTNGSTIERYVFTKQEDGTYQINEEQPEKVTGAAIAAREATAGKDLNGDAAIGFKVSAGAPLATQSNGWSLGTAAVDTPDSDDSDEVNDSPTIYIVGKNLGKMGSIASNLTNNAALFDGDAYWKPAEGESVISLVQKTVGDTSEVNIYTKLESEGVTSYVKHAFGQEDGKWALSGSTALTSAELIAEEASNKRDINGDSAVGLKVDSSFAVTGMSKAVIDNKSYYFAGNVLSGTGTRPLDLNNTRLLTDAEGNAWTPADEASISSWEVLGSTLPDDAPAGAKYLASLSDDSKQYFDSTMKALMAG
jgi:hypothetical protein